MLIGWPGAPGTASGNSGAGGAVSIEFAVAFAVESALPSSPSTGVLMPSLITVLRNIVLGIAGLIFALLVLAVVVVVVWLFGIAVSALFWILIPVAVIAIGFALFADNHRKTRGD
jgi:hypothetical protein